jgi:hypothetical protein
MKRDLDLVRQILLELEDAPTLSGWIDVKIDGRSREEIVYHVRLMHETGLIVAEDLSSLQVTDWRPKRMTNEGHVFLDAARSDTVWSKAKEKLLKATGVLTIEGMRIALPEVAKLLMKHS